MSKAETTVANACLELSEELASQPQLFDLEALPIDLEVTQAARRVANTGVATTRDEARALAIGACKLAGLTDAETARRLKCSRNTIAPVVEQLERSGKIPGLNSRLSSKLGRLAENTTDAIDEIVGAAAWSLDTSSAVRALGVVMGIAVDKHQLMTGHATAIIEQRVSVPAADAVRAWEDKLKQCFPVEELRSSDSGSVDLPHRSLIDKGNVPIATPLATTSSAPSPDFSLLCPPPQPGGGGDPDTQNPPDGRRLPPNNL
jgi:hypothetical protein